MGYDKVNAAADEPTETAAAIAAGAALAVATTPVDEDGACPYTVIPKAYAVHSLAEFLPRPLRIEQEVQIHDTDSFIAYVNTYGKEGKSLIFFNADEERFVGVLDYHEAPDKPAWCDHVAAFTVRRSVEFQTWMGSNRKQMTQVEFARFIEDNLPDIAQPPSAELLQVALTFEAKKSVEFASGVRLNNGQIQFQYDEVVRGTAQKGSIEIPEQFVLGIPIHMNGPAYSIPVRLRWRLQESKLIFWFEIVRPHKFLEDALREIRTRIEAETSIDILAGTAQ